MSVYRACYEVHDSKMTNYISCVDFCERALKNVCGGNHGSDIVKPIWQFQNHNQ